MYANNINNELIWIEEGDLEYFYEEVDQDNDIFTYFIFGQVNLKRKPR